MTQWREECVKAEISITAAHNFLTQKQIDYYLTSNHEVLY